MELRGQTAIITGAGSGIGRTVARRLAENGVRVALLGRRESRLRETQSNLNAARGDSGSYPSDATDPDQMQSVLNRIRQQLGDPSIVINNAGLHGEFTFIRDSDPSRWRETLLTNLYGPYLLSRLCLPAMLEGGWGRIVNVSSENGFNDPQGLNSIYSLSKYALNFFTRQLAQELEGTNITSTAIHPGEVQTEMWAGIKEDTRSRGLEAQAAGEWVAMVEKSGGDSPDKAADLILRILQADPADVNGKFLWIEDGIRPPRPTW